jgi:hypothetical protein
MKWVIFFVSIFLFLGCNTEKKTILGNWQLHSLLLDNTEIYSEDPLRTKQISDSLCNRNISFHNSELPVFLKFDNQIVQIISASSKYNYCTYSLDCTGKILTFDEPFAKHHNQLGVLRYALDQYELVISTRENSYSYLYTYKRIK